MGDGQQALGRPGGRAYNPAPATRALRENTPHDSHDITPGSLVWSGWSPLDRGDMVASYEAIRSAIDASCVQGSWGQDEGLNYEYGASHRPPASTRRSTDGFWV